MRFSPGVALQGQLTIGLRAQRTALGSRSLSLGVLRPRGGGGGALGRSQRARRAGGHGTPFLSRRPAATRGHKSRDNYHVSRDNYPTWRDTRSIPGRIRKKKANLLSAAMRCKRAWGGEGPRRASAVRGTPITCAGRGAAAGGASDRSIVKEWIPADCVFPGVTSSPRPGVAAGLAQPRGRKTAPPRAILVPGVAQRPGV